MSLSIFYSWGTRTRRHGRHRPCDDGAPEAIIMGLRLSTRSRDNSLIRRIFLVYHALESSLGLYRMPQSVWASESESGYMWLRKQFQDLQKIICLLSGLL